MGIPKKITDFLYYIKNILSQWKSNLLFQKSNTIPVPIKLNIKQSKFDQLDLFYVQGYETVI